jgi:hypothetical protein
MPSRKWPSSQCGGLPTICCACWIALVLFGDLAGGASGFAGAGQLANLQE